MIFFKIKNELIAIKDNASSSRNVSTFSHSKGQRVEIGVLVILADAFQSIIVEQFGREVDDSRVRPVVITQHNAAREIQWIAIVETFQ